MRYYGGEEGGGCEAGGARDGEREGEGGDGGLGVEGVEGGLPGAEEGVHCCGVKGLDLVYFVWVLLRSLVRFLLTVYVECPVEYLRVRDRAIKPRPRTLQTAQSRAVVSRAAVCQP